jgi:hypothetical protein
MKSTKIKTATIKSNLPTLLMDECIIPTANPAIIKLIIKISTTIKTDKTDSKIT